MYWFPLVDQPFRGFRFKAFQPHLSAHFRHFFIMLGSFNPLEIFERMEFLTGLTRLLLGAYILDLNPVDERREYGESYCHLP